MVVDLTPQLVQRYVKAFLSACPQGAALYVGQDLRPSSPAIAEQVVLAAQACGVDTVDCGVIPTPALAMAAMSANCGAVMVTGSHIPADRNGLKFYVPTGEVSKSDEAAIKDAYEAGLAPVAQSSGCAKDAGDASGAYVARYVSGFGAGALSGMRIGVYRHSSVARDIMERVFSGLGATVVPLANSDQFIPVDTEAVDRGTRDQLRGWCVAHRLDAIVSTDGDADRPMLTDAAGQVVAGDVLGCLTARFLGADVICTPVSSNDMVRRMLEFSDVRLTKIGSPFVIAEMEAVLANDPKSRVAGFEANGGFLLGFEAVAVGTLAPLMTRDSLLPLVAPLVAARAAATDLAGLVDDLPPCFTAADRLQNIDKSKCAAFLAGLVDDAAKRDGFFAPEGAIGSIDLTDGLRMNFVSGDVVHLRPSGNAPEFRIYTQADDPARATALVQSVMARVDAALGSA